MSLRLLAVIAALGSGAAEADELRDFCADRPGNGTPACTLDPGHVMLELGIADWTHDRQDGVTTDTTTFGDALLRYGVGDTTELQLGWTAYGEVKTNDSGLRTRLSGSGDITFAVRQNLQNPDGSGFSMAVMPFVTAPTGSAALGAGKWTYGLIVPMSVALPHDLSLAFTGEIDDEPDSADTGRHAAYTGTIGLGVPLTDAIGASLELTASRDLDPGAHVTQEQAAISVAWQVDDNLQLDLGSNLGLNRAAPREELYAGVARRF